jgi:acetyl-CoA C-acetyltransferase
MRRAAIISPVRTPIGKFLGGLSSVPVETLAAHVVKAVVARSGIDPMLIEDVVFAQS